MTRGTRWSLGALLAVSHLACTPDREIPEGRVARTGGELTGTGTVRLARIEMGCWQIIGDDGQTYLPVGRRQGLPKHLEREGLRVRFVALVTDDYDTFCPGTLITLEFVEAT